MCCGESTRAIPPSIGRACSISSSANEVAELLAQPRQRVRDRRLRASQPLGGAGDAAFDHQDIEHDQQVEIKPAQIDFIHDEHDYSLDR
jgi:hypothetical protein